MMEKTGFRILNLGLVNEKNQNEKFVILFWASVLRTKNRPPRFVGITIGGINMHTWVYIGLKGFGFVTLGYSSKNGEPSGKKMEHKMETKVVCWLVRGRET